MLQRKNATTRAFFSAAALPAQREAVQAAETMAATFAENPKLRGMTIVVTDDDGNTIRGGPGCLNRFSASISGASARVRLPSGVAAG